jgi:hypothetical protein
MRKINIKYSMYFSDQKRIFKIWLLYLFSYRRNLEIFERKDQRQILKNTILSEIIIMIFKL